MEDETDDPEHHAATRCTLSAYTAAYKDADIAIWRASPTKWSFKRRGWGSTLSSAGNSVCKIICWIPHTPLEYLTSKACIFMEKSLLQPRPMPHFLGQPWMTFGGQYLLCNFRQWRVLFVSKTWQMICTLYTLHLNPSSHFLFSTLKNLRILHNDPMCHLLGWAGLQTSRGRVTANSRHKVIFFFFLSIYLFAEAISPFCRWIKQ